MMYINKTWNNIQGFVFFDGAQVEIERVPVGEAPSLVDAWLMLGKDVDCGPLTYRSWVVRDTPDFASALYTGPRCGATPFTDVVTSPVVLNPSTWVMTARDPDCGPVTIVSWIAVGNPDFAGVQYTGPRCGVSPLVDVAAVPVL